MKYIQLLILLILPLQIWSQNIIIKEVNLLDVESKKIISEASVLISKDKISAIDKFQKLKTTNKDQIIDGRGKYLIPGLIDAHIHFFQSGGLYTRPDAIDFRDEFPYSKELQFAKENAADYLRRYLRNGITSVMDVGGPLWNFTVRDSIAANMTAPNVWVTGPLFSMVDRPQLDEGDPPIIKVNSKEDVDQLFQKMLPYSPDFIKIWYVLTPDRPAEKTYPLVAYLGELCRANDLKLAVHSTQLNTAQLAVKAGANILVHSVDDQAIPDSFAKELKEKGVTYVPTLTVGNGYYRTFTGRIGHKKQDLIWANPMVYASLMHLERIDKAKWPTVIKNMYQRDPSPFLAPTEKLMRDNLSLLAESGVNIATGTDAGNIGTLHASSYMEELLEMQKAGLSNWELLVFSTINPAKGFGVDDETGSISLGKLADLVLLSKNPLEDIQNLNAIELVFKSGQVLAPDSILVETPEQIVQRQVNAYNARDIDAFLATYAENIEIYNNAGELIMKGHDQMRTSYASMFEATPNLYCDIVNRMVINNKVIDKEKVRFNNQMIDAVAIYEVANGKIVKVTFVE